MKKIFTMFLMSTMVLGLGACNGKDNDGSTGAKSGSKGAVPGEKYVYDGYYYGSWVEFGVESMSNVYLDEGTVEMQTPQLPENYTCIPHDKFVEGFRALLSMTGDSTYADIAKAFGDDGIKLTNAVEEGYAYYSWVSDKDYYDSKKVHLNVTFVDKGNKLTYYMYNSIGIDFTDVQ